MEFQARPLSQPGYRGGGQAPFLIALQRTLRGSMYSSSHDRIADGRSQHTNHPPAGW
jgi:hypothetical protein